MSSRKKILVVDDEADLREILSLELEDAGFDVCTAESGNRAFEIIKSEPIDLVLSDVRMPNGDGISLLDNIRTLNTRKPVVLLITGFADITVAEAMARGAEAFFSKPIDFGLLIETIKRHLTPAPQRYQRKHERIDARFSIEVVYRPDASGPEYPETTLTLNLGRGGMFVMRKEHFPHVGEAMEFTLRFEDATRQPIRGFGVVRWIRPQSMGQLPPGIGIEFTDVDAPLDEKLTRLLEEVKTRAYIPIQ